MPININSLNENLITLLEHAIILNIISVRSESKDESNQQLSETSSVEWIENHPDKGVDPLSSYGR